MEDRNKYFKIEVTPPGVNYATGKLTLTFKFPHIHFAWHSGLYSYDQQKKMTVREAKQAFMSLIAQELDYAFEQAEKTSYYDDVYKK